MPVLGRGRIVVWEGASLWLLENANRIAEVQSHSHHAIQITFQLEGSSAIGVPGQDLCAPVTAVASDLDHTFRGGGAVAFLFIAPESAAGLSLGRELFAHRPWATLTDGPLAAAAVGIRACHRDAWPDARIREFGRSILGSLTPSDESFTPDRRVMKMIDFARSNLEGKVSLLAAAASVHLSEGRARHLFAAQTRIPFKAYVLWLRLERAVALYAQGQSLTEAAHEAGFADSAHFSRTFRRTFGLPAAALRLSN